MRGDRPPSIANTTAGQTATPHARGSTPRQRHHQLMGRGYPACAGIDLDIVESGPADSGLPRMRGDRPRSIYCRAISCVATPHARGSTLLGLKWEDVNWGYPACAGIDPYGSSASGLS